MWGMGMIAAGAYLRALRDKKGVSQGKLGELIGVAGNTIWRIEKGKQEPQGAQMVALLAALDGRLDDMQRLLSDATATADDGERLAQFATQIEDGDLDAAISLFHRLQGDPKALARWLGYGERLRDEHDE